MVTTKEGKAMELLERLKQIGRDLNRIRRDLHQVEKGIQRRFDMEDRR